MLAQIWGYIICLNHNTTLNGPAIIVSHVPKPLSLYNCLKSKENFEKISNAGEKLLENFLEKKGNFTKINNFRSFNENFCKFT